MNNYTVASCEPLVDDAVIDRCLGRLTQFPLGGAQQEKATLSISY